MLFSVNQRRKYIWAFGRGEDVDLSRISFTALHPSSLKGLGEFPYFRVCRPIPKGHLKPSSQLRYKI